jgi:transglutaminase/protease-like cytokinesis protein 3
MKRLATILFIMVFAATVLRADTLQTGYDFTEIDKKSAALPGHINSLDALASRVNSISRNEIEKARAIFVWMQNNIRYDEQTLKNFESGDTELLYRRDSLDDIVNKVFVKRKGVCGEMSYFYNAVAEKAGLKSVSVWGWYLEYTKKIYADLPNHRWNAVRAEGKWHLLDCAAKVSFLPPEEMIKTHYPIVPYWQLMDRKVKVPVTLGPPLDFPETKGSGVVLLKPDVLVNYQKGGVFRIEMQAPPNAVLYGMLMEDLDQKNAKYAKSVYGDGKHVINLDMSGMKEDSIYYIIVATQKAALYLLTAAKE